MPQSEMNQTSDRVDYVRVYLDPWRCERNRIHRLVKSVPRLRARLEKHRHAMRGNYAAIEV